MKSLPFSLSRSLVVRAPREVVFRYFTDPDRFARWWGEGSTIDGRVGGEVRIRYPNGVVALGAVEAIEPERRIVFTFGYETAHPELPPGTSRVTIELSDVADGTALRLRHDLPDEKMRDAHVPGWRYHLAVFANVVANEQFAGAAATVDAWFRAWAETDAAQRGRQLAACVTEHITLRDAWACVTGRDELLQHIGAVQLHMRGVVMRRRGEPRQCQGTALVDWTAAGPDGATALQGTNVVHFAPDGRIAHVVGIAGP